MAKLPNKPRSGQKTIAALYRSICQIIDYLPSLTVKGDGKSISVTNKDSGSIISVKNNNLSNWKYQGDYQKYIFGRGIKSEYDEEICSGLDGIPKELLPQFVTLNLSGDGTYISASIPSSITDPVIISYIGPVPSGGGGGGGTTILCGDFSYPNYFAMSDVELANVASFIPCGIGISWVLPVSANTRPCFYSNAGDGTAFGVFTSDVNEPNPQRIQMSNGIPVAPSTNGWCRISVFDSGNCAGSCLRFTSHFPAETPSYDYWNFTTPLYRFNGFKEFEPDSRTVFLCGGVLSSFEYTGVGDIVVNNQNHTISYDGSGGGGDVDLSWKTSYPDIQALRNGDYSNIAINGEYYTTSGQGISWLIPVQSGYNYKVYANNGDGKVWSTFASSLDVLEGQDERIDPIANGIAFAPSTDGWARISVFDDGSNEGECLRLFKYSDSDSGLEGMPLYRFHGFRKYTAGAGIDIESGIISCMIQPGQGLVSTALTAPGSNPYNPTITGYAFDLSTKFYDDLVTISGRTGNKVLSSSNGVLTWATNVTGGGDVFDAPDYAKLGVTTDAGETALGLGTTFLVPIAKGSSVRYEADGGTIIARWAPVVGSSKSAFNITTTNSTGTEDDGYARVSVIDPGTISAGCVRLYVDNKALPLHKFAMFNYSSGAIYQGGRYINIQTEETQMVNNVPVQVPLLNPIISCTLTGGNFITIQEEENGVALDYPRINCDLTGGDGIQITTGGVINLTGSTSPSTVYDLLAEGPNIKLTKLSNGKTQISGTPEGSGGGSTGGMSWPNYANLAEDSTNTILMNADYTSPAAGGWLRVSCTGSVSHCCSIYVDNHKVGMWGGSSPITFIVPITPNAHFYVDFPQNVTKAWFDNSSVDFTYTSSYVDFTEQYATTAYENAESAYNEAKSRQNDWQGYLDGRWSPDGSGTYWDYWQAASGYADKAIAASGKAYNLMTKMDTTSEYYAAATTNATSAYTCATSAIEQAVSAKYYYDLVVEYQQSQD